MAHLVEGERDRLSTGKERHALGADTVRRARLAVCQREQRTFEAESSPVGQDFEGVGVGERLQNEGKSARLGQLRITSAE